MLFFRLWSDIEPKNASVSRPMLDIIKEQVDAGFRKRDPNQIDTVFKKYAKIDRKSSICHIEEKNLLMALKEFDVVPDVTQEDLCKQDVLFRSLDRNQDGILVLDEFAQAVQAPMPLDEWASTLPLARILADAMPRKVGKDLLREVGRLTPDEINNVVDGFAYGLRILLKEYVEKLRGSFSLMDEKAAKASGDGDGAYVKFQAETKLRCGSIDDFHNGMASRIGGAFWGSL